MRSSRESPGPRDRIFDIYGSFVRDFGGWIAVADLLSLLADLGINQTSGRSSLSRMKRKGEIEPVSHGPVRGYSLSAPVDRWFADGTARIMEATPSVGGPCLWAIASFSVPEEERGVRYRIRTRLSDLGFGQISGGLMIAPSHILAESVRAIEQAELADYVDFWEAQHFGFRPPEDLVRTAWDLPAIESAYEDYLALAQELTGRKTPKDDTEAFVRYIVNINAWRELPFLDPGIPRELLPQHWLGEKAREVFTGVSSELRPRAWRHFVKVANS